MADEDAVGTFEIDGIRHPVNELTDTAKQLILSIKDIDSKMLEAKNLNAIFTRAKNSYVQGLKDEIVKSKAGF